MLIIIGLIVSLVAIIGLNYISQTLIAEVSVALSGRNLLRAVSIFGWVYLPGTFLHELSHWLTANLLGVKTFAFSVRPQLRENGLLMGYILRDRVDPLRGSLIGVAPLFFGCAAVIAIAQWSLHLDVVGQAISEVDPHGTARGLYTLFTTPANWLWLYLIFVISNTMLPSASDRMEWGSALLYSSLFGLFLLAMGFSPAYIPASLFDFTYAIAGYLFAAFMITIFVNLLFIGLIIAVVFGLSQIFGE